MNEKARKNTKELASTSIFNLLKIWGGGWLAFALVAIPSVLIRALRQSNVNTLKFDYILLSIMVGLVTLVILFLWSFREGYKDGHIPHSTSFTVLSALLPAVLHLLICVISNGSAYISTIPLFLGTVLAGMDTEAITVFHIFLISLLFDSAYGLALWFGSVRGRKKRAKDKQKLYESDTSREVSS